MSKHYKIMKSNVRERYKIEVTTKWFGITVWKDFASACYQDNMYDQSWMFKEEAEEALRNMLIKDEVYNEC